ncbi:MAG: ABC transporter substrate-binding protein [Clostridium sp.]
MKIKNKKLVAFSLVVSLLFSLAGCKSTNNTSKENTKEEIQAEKIETKIIVDHEGVEVEIPTEINRVVVANPLPIASVLSVYLGGAEKIVGMHPTAMSAAKNGLLGEIYPEILNAETDFVNGSEFNIEELLKINPDVVIGVPKEQAEAIRKAGIPAVTVSYTKWDYNVLETYDGWIELFDQIFGESETTKKVSQYSKEAYKLIQEKVSTIAEADKKKVLFLFNYDNETITTSGPSHYGQYWADTIGAINVAQESVEPETISINMEQIYKWNPDVIILTNFTSAQPEDLYNNAIGGDDWSTISAVQNGQVYKMPLGFYRTYTPGSDTPVTLQWLAKTVYPELFKDMNIEDVTKDYYKNYHNIDMTDEQIERMYNPPRESATGA